MVTMRLERIRNSRDGMIGARITLDGITGLQLELTRANLRDRVRDFEGQLRSDPMLLLVLLAMKWREADPTLTDETLIEGTTVTFSPATGLAFS